jgi:adenosine deaminase CECR1
MGISSKVDSPEHARDNEKAPQEPKQARSDTVKTTRRRRLADFKIANPFRSSPSNKADQSGRRPVDEGDVPNGQGHEPSKGLKPEAADSPAIERVLEVPEHVLKELRVILKKAEFSEDGPAEINHVLEDRLAAYAAEKAKEYDATRQQGVSYESSLGFDYACTRNAKEVEVKANEKLQQLKKSDVARVYEAAPKRRGYRGQEHPRFCGDHFLSNADLIEQTQLFALCRAMPKGAHLHIHFNANLLPSVLLGIAKDMERMFIWSNIPLDRDEAFDLCRIQFSIMSPAAVEEKGTGIPFHSDYQGGAVMQFQQFREAYPGGPAAADSWLQKKLVFQEEETHNLLQTQDGCVFLFLEYTPSTELSGSR